MVKISATTELLSTMLDGVMFHGEQADIFEFLNYKGFAEMHRHQTFEEYKCFRKMRDFLISATNSVEKISYSDRKNTIPEVFYSATKLQVTPQERKKYTKESFDKYVEWENTAMARYKKIYAQLVTANEFAIAEKVAKVIKHTSEEIMSLHTLYIELENTEYGAHHLERIQPELSSRYE